MKNYFVFFFALIGISVLLGAFGSHFIYQLTEDEKLVSSWMSTLNYQFIHALGGILMLLIFKQCAIPDKWPVNLLIAGLFLFCGAYYVKLGLKLYDPGMRLKYLNYLRPVGGILFVVGWFGAASVVNRKIVREAKRDSGKRSRRK
tara:strand:- start:334 stop:768 length:435 start_codon:yes stop_codon:yes gene_type:complete